MNNLTVELYSAKFIASFIAIFLLSILYIPCIALAEDGSWSFETHPPSYDENLPIWSEHIEEIASRHFETPCRAYEEIAYAKYQELHPEYVRFAELPGMREAWLEAAIAHDMFANCYFRNLHDDITASFPVFTNVHLGIVYCGNVSRAPQNDSEARAIRSFMLLMQIANSGNFKAINELLGLENARWQTVRYDPRFRHYFLTLVEQVRGDNKYLDAKLSWKENAALLEADDREMVQQATDRRDLAALLAMLPLCQALPQPEMGASP